MGVKLVIVGVGTSVKLALLVAVPLAVVTVILPVLASVGTTAVMALVLTTLYDAALTPLNLTAVAPVKFVPLIVIGIPTPALMGVKLKITGFVFTV